MASKADCLIHVDLIVLPGELIVCPGTKEPWIYFFKWSHQTTTLILLFYSCSTWIELWQLKWLSSFHKDKTHTCPLSSPLMTFKWSHVWESQMGFSSGSWPRALDSDLLAQEWDLRISMSNKITAHTSHCFWSQDPMWRIVVSTTPGRTSTIASLCGGHSSEQSLNITLNVHICELIH